MSSFSMEASILTFSVISFSYLLGSIPFGILVSKVFGLGNLRHIGSGNIGATNVLRTGNKLAALITLIFDGLWLPFGLRFGWFSMFFCILFSSIEFASILHRFRDGFWSHF